MTLSIEKKSRKILKKNFRDFFRLTDDGCSRGILLDATMAKNFTAPNIDFG